MSPDASHHDLDAGVESTGVPFTLSGVPYPMRGAVTSDAPAMDCGNPVEE
ncbi:hypothetical protein Afil01_02090 [Actinorhabdospora filicis]|uniref:Uncharacterized protein n=1 Tax=Actinorhabdospora filicis TaxID=1785913 RepID=A0A9W6SG57_9ACTN|nr:hypothetical protein [Actinorhabdospora filicis]GLZ75402.1 hypothetical protein Afil01_02090 [Actinorhabdospora filicis]